MKKAELEAHYAGYEARMRDAHAAERQGLYREAVTQALAAWDFIDGMMQYLGRYENREFNSVPAIEFVLKYAPLLLDSTCLDRLDALLNSSRRIEKKTSSSMSDKLARAREELWCNHRLWSHLEAAPGCRQDELRHHLAGEQDYWRSVAESWEKMGLLCRTPDHGSYRLSITTCMDEVVSGKCSSCGMIAEAPKAMFLESMKCLQCRERCLFVILSKPIAIKQQD